jgi:cytochrome P450
MERVVELGVLLVAATLALRILSMPAARRELREHPRFAAILALLGVAAVAAVIWAAVRSPIALRWLAIGAIAWVAFFAWRSRPGRGRSRSRPPGSLGLKSSLDAIVDRSFYSDQAQRHGPVFKMAQFHQPVVCIVDIQKGRELLKRESESLVLAPLPISAEIPRGFIRYMKPDDYAVYSRLFRSAFSEVVLEANREYALEIVRRELGALATAVDGGPQVVDPRGTVEEIMFAVLLQVYFGDDMSPYDRNVIEGCCRDIGSGNTIGRASPRARRALQTFEERIRERSRSDPAVQHDRSSVWGEVLRLKPEAVSDSTAIGNLLLLLEASRDSIGGLLIWILKNLAESRESVEAIRGAEHDVAPARDLTECVVLETLRLAQSEYVYRKVVRPIEFDGFKVPRGWFIRICVAEVHRQNPPFDRPEVFDPTRFASRRFSRDEFSPFGLDHHACMGASLTMFVSRAFVDVLARDFDARVVADGAPERGNRHWNHWRPSSELRIALSHAEVARPETTSHLAP